MKKLNWNYSFLLIGVLSILNSCINNNPNTDKEGQDQLESLEIDHELSENELRYQEVFYVPIYSDIYVDNNNPKCLLSATLSIRNVSSTDTLFISKIEYFDTDGHSVRNYISKTIALPAMASVNYVVERDDETGGSGANFIVEVSAAHNISVPRIQAIMIGDYSNKGLSFVVEGEPLRAIEK